MNTRNPLHNNPLCRACIPLALSVFLLPLGTLAMPADSLFIEAEEYTLTGAFAIGSDAAASGGQYIHVPDGFGNGGGTSPAPLGEANRAIFTFDVVQSGNYRIRGGVYTPPSNGSNGNDSFFVRVDGGVSYLWDVLVNTGYQVDFVGDRNGADPVEIFLGVGQHTVEVLLREDGTRLDNLELVLAEESLFIEAEEYTLTGAFAIGSDAAASGGQYIHVPDGFGNGGGTSPAPLGEANRAIFTFDVVQSGNYRIRGGVYTPPSNGSNGNDSFFVRVDGGVSYLWDVLVNTGYQVDFVGDRNGADPVEIFLGVGQHTVEVLLREDGTRLDNLELVLAESGNNSSPIDLSLIGSSIPENSANGTFVGTVTTTDPDLGEAFDYLLTDDAGGRFAINAVNGQITVVNGSLLDFETAASHAVTVQVTGSASNTRSETFTIQVTELFADNPIIWSAEIAARVAAGGTIRMANSNVTFNSAVSASSPGDVVLLVDGTYGGGTSYNLNGDGLLVTAQNLGGVTFEGGARLIVTSDNNTIGGFNFENLNQRQAVLFDGASNNRFTDSRFVNSGIPSSPNSQLFAIRDGSNNNRFDHNDFAGNRTFGLVILLPRDRDFGTSDYYAYSQDNRIDHNVFRDMLQANNESRIPLQIGQSSHNLEETRTLVDHNEFRDMATRGSIINSKSGGVTYLNNRFIDIPRGHLSLRDGDNARVEGNYFENVLRGVTVVGANHTVINNVIVNPREAGILIHNWGNTSTTNYDSTRDILIANNTIIDPIGSANAIEIGRNWGSPATARNLIENLRVISNIFQGSSGELVDIRTTPINFTLQNNLYYATGSATVGNLGTQSIVGNPNLTGTYELSASSTLAIDAGVALSEVVFDFDRNARTDGAIDVGAHEFGSIP